jgi:Putative porin
LKICGFIFKVFIKSTLIMVKYIPRSAALLALASGALSSRALAQDSGALLDALVQEGVIKESKAEAIRAKLAGDFAKTPAGKIKFDSSIKELKFYGDARFRYQWDEIRSQTKDASTGDDKRSLQRERIRLRIGADAKLSDEFTAGFQLSTGQTSDSDNQTVGSAGEGGGFGKFPIFISKAYLGWEPIKGLGGVIGKQANPFYTNEQGLVWDADINPVGLSQKAELHKLYGWVGPWEVTLNAGQFTFADNNEGWKSQSNGTDLATDAFLFQAQAVVGFKFDDSHKLTAAPSFLTYNAASTKNATGSVLSGGSATAATVNGSGFAAANGTRGLQLLLLPGDFTTKVAGIKTKFVWDFSYNLDGETRAYDVYGLARTGAIGSNRRSATDDYAWLVGLVLGENKKKGDFSLLANYRATGLTAVDPNLNDSDFANSRLNTRGFKLGVGYNLSNAVVLNLAYQNAFNLRSELDSSAIAGSATIPWSKAGVAGSLADRNNVQIFQADVTVKF